MILSITEKSVMKAMDEPSLLILSALTHQAVCMRIGIDVVAKGLNAGHNTSYKLCAGNGLEAFPR
jgi:hypothetical protein